MTGQTFFWLAVFETITAIEVPQDEGTPGFSEPTSTRQAITQRWNRSGTVNISPGQATEDVVKNIATGCKEGGGIPADSLLTNIVLLPNFMIQR